MPLTDYIIMPGEHYKNACDAIRSKSGKSELIKSGDMATEISEISTTAIENLSWHQCPQSVRDYLEYVKDHPYTEDNYDVSYIANFAPSSPVLSNTKPIGYTIDGVTFYDNEPGVETPFLTDNSAGTLTALDHLRWYNTTPADPAEGSMYQRGRNCRDLGGWPCDGGTVKYGVLVRGSEPNPVDKELMVDKIGIKTEVQLLPINEQPTNFKMKSPWGIDWAGNDTDDLSVYSPEDASNTRKKQLWKKILIDIMGSVIHNKPVYFHCGVGADRTGIVSMILEAILGVSQCYVDVDFELTDFAQGWNTINGNVYRARNYPTNIALMNAIKNIPLANGLTDSFRNHCISFVLSCGISIDMINQFRVACINGTPDTINININNYSITKNGNNIAYSNEITSVDEYQSYNVEIIPDFGYGISSISVTMNEVDITNKVFSGEVINISHRIITNLNNSTINNEKTKVNDGDDYTTTVTPNKNNTISSVSVTMNGVDITEDVFIGINDSDDEQTPHSDPDTQTFSIQLALNNSIINNEKTEVNDGDDYAATITPEIGYIINDIAVTMGGVNITDEVFIGNSIGNNEEDDPHSDPDTQTYSVQLALNNSTINNEKTEVINNESYAATITAESGYIINGIAVTMGGVNITDDAAILI